MSGFSKRSGSKNKTFSLSAIAVALLTVGYVASPTVLAAEKEADDVEVIEVTGIRGSIGRSLAVKQDATGFVDAISAEDVGKLPDANVAEAMQRITGVTIQRSRGEGDFVSIRGLGPDFVRGSVNGRTLLNATESVDPIFNGNSVTSTGRAANFDILPSEIITNLDVMKSTSASHVEGGIGGAVNVQTARPLAIGNKVSASLTGTYRDFNEDTDPSGSGLISWVSDDSNFGILGSVAYSQRTLREDFSRSFGWFPSFGISSQLDTNNDGSGDANPSDVPFSLSNNAESYEENRDRLTVTSTLQWAGDDSEFTVDFLYSKREVEEIHQNFIFLPIIFDGDLAGNTTNPDGSVQVGDLVKDGSFFRHQTSLRPELTTDLQNYEDDLFSVGANYSVSLGEWDLTADISYSKAEGSNTFDRVRIDGNNGQFTFDSTVDLQKGFNIQQTNIGNGAKTDLGNPANFVVSVFDDRFATNEDEEIALKFDASKAIDHDVISSIEIGARIRTREKSIQRASNGNGIGVSGAGVTLADVGTHNSGASNFLDGMWGNNFGFNNLVFPDNSAARTNANVLSFMKDNGLSTNISADPFGSFDVEENTYAAYFQVNLDGELGGVPYAGDIGFRVVLTKQTINGFDAEFVISDAGGMDTTVFDSLSTGSATPISFDDSYANVLPSLNLRFELDDNLFLRVASNKSLTRPTFNSLAPAFNINANSSTNLNGDNFAVSLGAGNPSLKPYEATSYDIGLEWYFAESSALYASIFHKDIENYIASSTSNVVTELAGASIRAIGVELNGSRSPIAIDQVSQPDNQGEAQITGLELGYQQAFDSGFGYIANFTLTENSAEYEATGKDIDFPGVSEVSYNLAGYYENGPLQARVAYSYRSEYLVEPSAIGFGGQLFNDEYAQLDASISYDIFENTTIFLNAVNLTDEDQDVYSELPNIGKRYYSTSHVGPRVSFGIRGNF